jgi:LmbE family N-acetylglucosaminyl deacetylase
MTNVRLAACRLLESLLHHRLEPFRPEDWAGSAVVFAPHQDDETLGCGGAAHKIIVSGGAVRFVFVTDGAASHHGRIEPERLRRVRQDEAIEAVRRLGAPTDNVTFLRFPDGTAEHHIPAIAAATEPLLAAWRPQCVFLPHAQDPHPDHVAVNAAVRAALRNHGHAVTVFEYPVWYWYHWPWVRIAGDLSGMWRKTVRQTLKTGAGVRALYTFNTLADIRDVRSVKREALAAHASQTTRPMDFQDWPILADLSQGDFLAQLVADYEAFTRYEVGK